MKNPKKAQEYAQLKIGLQKRFKHNHDAYTEAKGDFIRQCVKEAREQYRPETKSDGKGLY